MKWVCTVAVIVYMLTGCSNVDKEIDRGMALRDKLLSSQCEFEAEVTADYGDSLYIFSVNCQGNSQGGIEFTVTKPQTISGIKGRLTDEGGKLIFDDTALHFDMMADDQLSPISAPWILLKTLRSGYLTSASEGEELLHLTINDSFEEDALHLDIWLNSEDMPVRGEILHDGRRILSLDIKNFTIG